MRTAPALGRFHRRWTAGRAAIADVSCPNKDCPIITTGPASYRALCCPATQSVLPFHFRVFEGLVTFADRLGAVQLTFFRGRKRVLRLMRLLADLAGPDKAALRLIILAGGGAVTLALVWRDGVL